MRSYFPSDENSEYYNSKAFKLVLDFLNVNSKSCEMIENKGKLSMKIRNIHSIKEAKEICQKIMKQELNQQ